MADSPEPPTPTQPIQVHHFPPRYGERPLLGRLEVREFEDDAGQRSFAVRAPEMPEDQEVTLSSDALIIAGYFDGKHDLREIQREIYKEYGQLLYVERLHSLASALYKAGLLDGFPTGESTDEAAES